MLPERHALNPQASWGKAIALRPRILPQLQPVAAKLSSRTITFTVRPVPVDQRTTEPTAEQAADLAAIQKIPERKQVDVWQVREARLRDAAARTENEGLALTLARQLIHDWDHGASNATRFTFLAISDRAGYRLDDPGIDGPDLKLLADAVLDRLGKPSDAIDHSRPRRAVEGRSPSDGILFAVFYTHHHPEDDAFRKRLTVKLQQTLKDPWDEGTVNLAPGDAWRVMLETGILHDGMTIERAIELLGEPHRRDEEWIEWYHSTPRHVNPAVRGHIENGKLADWHLRL